MLSSSVVRSMEGDSTTFLGVVIGDGKECLEEEATAFPDDWVNPLAGEPMASNADRARLNGVERVSSTAGASRGDAANGDSVSFVGVAVGAGVGEGDGDTSLDPTDGLRAVLPLPPPPKKLFNVVCRPENSSKNLVAKRGGSGALRGGSVG